MAEKINVVTERRSLKEASFLDANNNARYMEPREYTVLVENLKRDGVLTSAPLWAQIEGEDFYRYVSGNHRGQAALDAGIEEADVMVIQEPISRERFVAIQLSHNAITGKDDPNKLFELYSGLGLEFKDYSGLSDYDFEMDKLPVISLPGVNTEFVTVQLHFLNVDYDDITALDDFVGSHKNDIHLLASGDQYNQFVDAVIDGKALTGIHNAAMVVHALCVTALEMMKQAEAAKAEAEEAAGGEIQKD